MGVVSARGWNVFLDRVRSRYPVRAVIDYPAPSHAWQVTPAWDPSRKKWTATLRPGCVNGRPAVIPMVFSKSPQAWRDLRMLLPNPPRETQTEGVPLDFRPQLDLVWRRIGNGARPLGLQLINDEPVEQYEAVPEYFRQQGVLPANFTGPPPDVIRNLYACDLLLRQPRAYLVNEISAIPDGILGATLVSVNPVPTTPPDVRDPARVVAISRYVAPQINLTVESIFFQRFLDEPVDEYHLSTVYALSPVLEKGEPQNIDETHTLETKYYAHYNFQHATRIDPPRQVTPAIRLVTGLAAGLGDVLYNFILATQNDFTQGVLDMFNQRDLRGTFWEM